MEANTHGSSLPTESGYAVLHNHICFTQGLLTNTAYSSGVQLEVWWAVTLIATRRVHTEAVDTVYGVCTLINVYKALTMEDLYYPSHIRFSKTLAHFCKSVDQKLLGRTQHHAIKILKSSMYLKKTLQHQANWHLYQ